MDSLVQFTDELVKPDSFYKYTPSIARNRIPIVIDNGTLFLCSFALGSIIILELSVS